MIQVVEEADLDFIHFHCCGDEDLYPFGCPNCDHLMVFCYECDTLYHDLKNLALHSRDINCFVPTKPIFTCNCGKEFEYFFIRDGLYKVPLAKWLAAGFGNLLEGSGRA
jgi:hypothetical protein